MIENKQLIIFFIENILFVYCSVHCPRGYFYARFYRPDIDNAVLFSYLFSKGIYLLLIFVASDQFKQMLKIKLINYLVHARVVFLILLNRKQDFYKNIA